MRDKIGMQTDLCTKSFKTHKKFKNTININIILLTKLFELLLSFPFPRSGCTSVQMILPPRGCFQQPTRRQNNTVSASDSEIDSKL